MCVSIRRVDPEVHARYLAAGLTRFTYAEVDAAEADVRAAAAECDAVYQAVYTDIFKPFACFPLWEGYLPAHLEPLYKAWACVHEEGPVAQMGKGRELFPLAQWQKTARKYRRLAAQLPKARDQVALTHLMGAGWETYPPRQDAA